MRSRSLRRFRSASGPAGPLFAALGLLLGRAPRRVEPERPTCAICAAQPIFAAPRRG